MTYQLSDLFEGTYKVSQAYGNNPAYYKQFGLAGHEGVDWATPVGVNVLAPFDGIVLRDSIDKNYGTYLVIWDPKQQCAVWYCHLSKAIPAKGSRVVKGQTVGQTGNTGNTTGPHLHVNFVQTDAYANRLNLQNGYQGFLNILQPKLVNWTLTR